MPEKILQNDRPAEHCVSPWFVGETTPINSHLPHFEPPNRASQNEVEALYPSTAPHGGEER